MVRVMLLGVKMGSDCWNVFFRATRKGILSVNSFFRLRQLLFDRWVACANLLQCSTRSALASLSKKLAFGKQLFEPRKFCFGTSPFSLSGLGKQHIEPRACFAVALPFHLWASGLESTKNLSRPDFFVARHLLPPAGTFKGPEAQKSSRTGRNFSSRKLMVSRPLGMRQARVQSLVCPRQC